MQEERGPICEPVERWKDVQVIMEQPGTPVENRPRSKSETEYVVIPPSVEVPPLTQVVENKPRSFSDIGASGSLSDFIDYTKIFEAIDEGVERLEYLQMAGADLNQRSVEGMTPLMYAVDKKKKEAVQLLLEHGVEINATDVHGNTALHYACFHGNYRLGKMLVEHKADISKPNKRGQTPRGVTHVRGEALKSYLATKEKERKGMARKKRKQRKKIKNTKKSGIWSKVKFKKSSTDLNGTQETKEPLEEKASKQESPKKTPESEGKQNTQDRNDSNDEEIDAKERQRIRRLQKDLYFLQEKLRATQKELDSKEANLERRERDVEEKEEELRELEKELDKREAVWKAKISEHRDLEIAAAVPIVPFEELQMIEQIGEGGFSEVYKALWRGDFVAVKKMKPTGDNFLEEFKKEAAFLSRVRHKNIVLLMGVSLSDDNLSLIFELLPSGTVKDMIHNYKESSQQIPMLSPEIIMTIAIDTASAMNYLHSMNYPVIHRDLKADNLMFNESKRVKLIDMGISVHDSGETFRGFGGTAAYMAPECLREDTFDIMCDVFSYGVLLWETLTRQKPWGKKGKMELVAIVGYNNERLPLPTLPPGCPQLVPLIKKCWVGDPASRPSFKKILIELVKIGAELWA